MKKIATILILATAITFLFTGCGAKPSATNDTPPNAQNGDRQSMRQSTPADINGEVDTISINSVTLKLIASQPRATRNPDATRSPNSSSRPTNFGDIKVQYTGQTQTITIADNIPITTFSRGANGPQNVNIKISDIKKGDRLQAWYADKELKTIARITVMPQRTQPTPSPATN